MPRIQLKKEEYMMRDTSDLIRSKMHQQGITQKDIGKMIGRTQSNVSERIKKMNFRKNRKNQKKN